MVEYVGFLLFVWFLVGWGVCEVVGLGVCIVVVGICVVGIVGVDVGGVCIVCIDVG